MQSDKEKTNNQDSSEILEIARKRFQLAVEAETESRREALDDLKFRAGEQWPDEVKRARDLDRRPCLTINRLPQFVRQVTNDQRQNRPGIRVSPVDDKADVDTATIIQGLIRHIEYNSNAEIAYDTAFESAVVKGIGYFRIITDYCDPTSFEQEILIKRIRNSFSVYVDPHYQEPDGSDMNWAFIFEDLAQDEYKSLYKDSKLTSMSDWTSIGDMAPGWTTNETVRIAEYFYIDFKEVTLCQLATGEVVEKDKLPKELPENFKIVAERKARIPKVKWCKLNGIEILEETELPGTYIPIIPVLGDELDINGKRQLEGIIRHAKDPQRMYNYWASSETETIALAPRAPFIGVEGQFEGHESQWKTANTRNHSFLQYKAKTVNGILAPPPQRNVYEPPVQAITQARMQSSEDLKATTGIYDATLGNRSNETSGVAIQRRNQQAQTTNYHFIDNMARALKHAGRIILSWIPEVYDTARTVRIIGEDDQQEVVQINQIFEKKGKATLYDLSTGKYDIVISTGPSYQTKRQEAVATMLDLAKSYPNLPQVAGDLLVKSMDIPLNNEIAERIRKSMPPGLADDPKDNQSPLPPEAQQAMQQMNQVIENLTQHLNHSNQIIEQKTLELESKERIEFAKMEVDLKKTLAMINSKEAVTAFQEELTHLRHRLDLLHTNIPIGQEMEEAPAQGMPPQTTNQQQPPTGGSVPHGTAPGPIME